MSHELICNWLGLPSTSWPPDHYTLLALTPGEGDAARIEQAVHDRMDRVRRYQLTHPEPATEAMNCLARALCCLTDPAAKKAYDAVLFPEAAPQLVTPAPAPIVVAAPVPADPMEWLYAARPAEPAAAQASNGPAPVPVSWETSPPPPRARLDTDTVEAVSAAHDTTVIMPVIVQSPTTMETESAARSGPLVIEQARLSSAARRGLGTTRALYYRIARTRRLHAAWRQAGKYLRDPERALTKPAEANDLTYQLQTIRDVLRNFPPLIGEAGQPGYMVLALAQQPLVAPTFQGLIASQRESLARDWQSGDVLLTAHRQFLRDELRTLRRRGSWGRGWRTFRAAFTDNAGSWLLLLAAVALNLASPELRRYLPEQIVIGLALGALNAYLWWDNIERTRPPRLVAPPPPPQRPRRRPNAQRQIG